jgi:hypothetical protein
MSDALAPVADMVELQFFLGHSLSPPQQASTCYKASLLAIGDHIEGGGVPEWLRAGLEANAMWSYVTHSARHRMAGPQLQALYCGLKERRAEAQRAALGAQSDRRIRALREEEEQVAACVANAKALMVSQQEQETASRGFTMQQDATGDAGGWGCWPLLPPLIALLHHRTMPSPGSSEGPQNAVLVGSASSL